MHGAEGEFPFDPWEQREGGVGGCDLEECFDGVLLCFDHRFLFCVLLGGVLGGQAEGNVFGQENVCSSEDCGALECVFEFAHVARPRIGLEDSNSLLGEFDGWTVFLVGAPLQEIFGKKLDVFDALAEWGDVDADDVEAVEEVFAEGFFGDLFLEILVCGADDPDIGAESLVAAHAGELAFLKDPEDFALDLKGHLSDFVEEEGALVALFKAADTLAGSTGERTLLVAEEFTFEEIVGNGRTIDGEEIFIAAGAEIMDGAGNEFFS